MLTIYSSYKCKICHRDFVLLSEDIITMAKDRYLVCPYCNSKRVGIDKTADSVKECMKERSYKRVSGIIRQK